MATIVNAIRDSIALEQNNQLVTNPFDLASARRLYQLLFGPVDDEMARTRHVIFEPDGALLKLPANLLVTADDGIAAHLQKSCDQENQERVYVQENLWHGALWS